MPHARRTNRDYVRKVAEDFLDQVENFDDITMECLAGFAGVSISSVYKAFPHGSWAAHKDAWLLGRIRRAMDEIYASSKTRRDFSVEKILKLCGIGVDMFQRLAGEEYLARASTLQTASEKVLLTLKTKVDAGVALSELNRKSVFAAAGVNPRGGPWFTTALRSARQEIKNRLRDQPARAPASANIRLFPGGRWIDLDADVWDLKFASSGQLVQRDRIRSDIRDIAWAMLRQELQSTTLSVGTICYHFRCFLLAGELLGDTVLDCRTASLDGIQRAWVRYKGSPGQKKRARSALTRLFRSLVDTTREGNEIASREMVKISSWLETMTSLPHELADESFLSEAELDELIEACLTDILAGTEFANGRSDLLQLTTLPRAEVTAHPVVQWSVALVILVIGFTGLRRQSVLGLKVDDLARIREDLYALAWRHGKKSEENVAVFPAALAALLEDFIRRTHELRAALKTDFIFLAGDDYGCWCVTAATTFNFRLRDFVERHDLKRGEVSLPLTCMLLRRTYVTRELYEGRSIWILRLQLGHANVKTTRGYGKFDLYEHPSRVRPALDQFGRSVLGPWCHPVVLDELAPEERTALLADGGKRDQGVGCMPP